MQEDGEGLAAEPVALYLKDEDKWALLHIVIKAVDSEDSKEGTGSWPSPFFQSLFSQISTAPIDN